MRAFTSHHFLNLTLCYINHLLLVYLWSKTAVPTRTVPTPFLFLENIFATYIYKQLNWTVMRDLVFELCTVDVH